MKNGMMQCLKLLMLDEPSLGLAPVVVQQVFEIIRSIDGMGTTILLAEQNVQSSPEIADRAYIIENGKNVMEGAASQLLANEDLRAACPGMQCQPYIPVLMAEITPASIRRSVPVSFYSLPAKLLYSRRRYPYHFVCVSTGEHIPITWRGYLL